MTSMLLLHLLHFQAIVLTFIVTKLVMMISDWVFSDSDESLSSSVQQNFHYSCILVFDT